MSYIDCIPIRVSIQNFESLTSQIICNCQVNCIRSINGVAAVFFSDDEVRGLRRIADFPPLSLKKMAKALNVTEEDLLRTTFYHLARKFGRSTYPQAISRFLVDILASVFRYCPYCLKNHLYYRLPWRFICTTMCQEHNCEILDRCSFCGQGIPIFKSPLRIGVCPTCDANLQECSATMISDACSTVKTSIMTDIEYLLTPQEWEWRGNEVVQVFGQRLAKLREERPLTLNVLSDELGISRSMIECIEHGNFSTRGATFTAY